MKNVLITGVAGFIGSNLADRLIKLGNYNIIGIDNLSYGVIEQVPKEVKFYKEDIRNKDIYKLFKDIDCVFHFAAKNCISDCQIDPLETIDINVYGTINVFELSRQNNVKKIIYAESSALYEGSKIFPTPENDINPESFYSLSKYSSKIFADGYNKFFKTNSTALRYFNVYGPKQDYRRTIPPLFSSFIIKLLKNEQPIIYGNGEKRRDFIHVDDINDFHIICMNDNRTDNEVFNLGYGKNYSVNEIYDIISKELNSDIKPKYLNDLPGETFQNLADITKAKKLGWYPKIRIEDGLKSSIDFIKKEYNKGNI
jgi:UDP-glucose 4-epimerase